MSGLLESIKELIKNEYGAVSDKEYGGLLSKAGLKSGTKSDKEQVLKNFKNASKYIEDGALSGWLTQQMPYLTRIGVGNFDRNLPPHELRKLIEAITTGRFGGVSDKETTYGIEVDGEEKDYTFTGDKEFDSSTMDKFRETHGITKGADSDADTLPATIRYLMSKGQVELAGLVANGKMEAHVAINIANKLANSPQGVLTQAMHDAGQRSVLANKGYNFITDKGARGAMSQEEIGKYPDLGWTNVNDSQEVKTFLNNMSHADRVQVEAMRQRVTEPQFQDFMSRIMRGGLGGGAIHEALPFQQYKTGNPHLQNLGF